MSTDVARLDGNAVAVLGTATDALDRLGRWVAAARDAHALVSPLIGTAFVPEAYKPKVDPRATPEQRAEAHQVAVANATAAVLQGISLGLDPLTALQQIYIVHGRPGMYAKLMVALVQAHGHDVWTDDLTDTRAVVCGRRSGTDHVERVTITMDQARKAGWTSNQAYTKTPQDMLWARAAARVCDRIASDVLKGITSVEQIRDEIKATADVGPATRIVTPRRRAGAPAVEAAAVVEEPALDEELEPAAVEHRATDPALITTPQQRKLHALLRKHGLTDRDLALVHIAAIIGHELASTKDLTQVEAAAVIDALDTTTSEPDLDSDDWPPATPAGDAS